MGAPAAPMRGSSSALRLVSGLTQRDKWPVTQCSQWPQNTDKQVITWSPGLTVRTSEPTCSTMPAASWPSTHGSGAG